MVMGHVFAMFLDHIRQGFVMAEVPTWEIHFPGMVPVKRQLCSPIVSILQFICKWSKTCLAFLPAQLIPKSLSNPCCAQPWRQRSPWAHPQVCAELLCSGQVGRGAPGCDRHLTWNHGFCKVNRALVTSLQPQFQLENAGVWGLQSLPALFHRSGASFSANITNQFWSFPSASFANTHPVWHLCSYIKTLGETKQKPVN